MQSSNKSFLNFLSYVVLVIVALLIFVNQLLPLIGVVVGGTLFNILSTIERVLTLVIIGLLSFNFTAGKGKAVKIIYWIAVAIFVAGLILIWVA